MTGQSNAGAVEMNAARFANEFAITVDMVSARLALVTSGTFQGEIERTGRSFEVRVTNSGVLKVGGSWGPDARLIGSYVGDGFDVGAHVLATAHGFQPGTYTLAVNRVDGGVPTLLRRTFVVPRSVWEFHRATDAGEWASDGDVPQSLNCFPGWVEVLERLGRSSREQGEGPLTITVEPLLAEWLWRVAHRVFESTQDRGAADLMRSIEEAIPAAVPTQEV